MRKINTSIIKDIRIWIDKNGVNPAEELKNILDGLNLENKTLGVEYEAYGLTGRNSIKLNNSLNLIVNFIILVFGIINFSLN